MAERPSPAARVLRWLAGAICEHRAWFGWPHLVLAILCVWYTVKFLEFRTNRIDLVGGEKEYHKIFLAFRNEFPIEEDIVVIVESEQQEKNRQFVERLGGKLERETNIFNHVFYKGDLRMMGRKALMFVPAANLQEMEATLQNFRPFVQQFTRATNLVSLFDLVNTQIRTAREEENAKNKALIEALPALKRIIDQAVDGLMRSGIPPSPGLNALFAGGDKAEKQLYITAGEGRIYLATAQAASRAMQSKAVERMRELVAETEREVPGANVGITGESVLEYDEMLQSQKDTTLATVVSLGLVALIFIYGYHETGRPLKATISLLIGIAYTMGFMTLTVGHLNILTITFVPILIGLAIDFGVHLITRYEEELRRGRSQREALEKAMVNTGVGIFTGAFTTAGAFFAMAFTDFKGIKEMGIICGGGLLVSLIPMMTLLPVLILRGRQNTLDQRLGPQLEVQEAKGIDRRARLENIWLRRPYVVAAVVTVITAASLILGRNVGFDYNLLHMQSRGLAAVLFQNKLIESSKRSLLFSAIVASNLTHATNLIATLTNLPTVGGIDSMAPYLAEDISPKARFLEEVKAIAGEIKFEPADRQPVDLAKLNQALFSLQGYLQLIARRVESTDPNLHATVTSLRQSASALRQHIEQDDRVETSTKLSHYQQALFDDVRETFEHIQQQDTSGQLTVADLPDTLRTRFVGRTGKLLLQVYPKKDVWEHEPQEEFVTNLRTVAPHATGTPVQLYEYTGLLKKSFEEAALYSLAAIAVLIFIHFRSFSSVVLSLIPVGIGSLWMIGMMGCFGVQFNPANIMTLPLVVGIGVTNGIHILNRFAEEQHPSVLAKSTGKAVLVSGLTTIAGFGSLMVARHRGIESLGFVMAVGTTTCMVVGLTFLPALLNILSKAGWTIRKTQRDNAQSTLGREEPRF